jgi:hypothetical protein
MDTLLTIKEAAAFLGLTQKAAEKLLHSLGVRKINFALAGGKGIRYRRADIEKALEKITIERRAPKSRPRCRRNSPTLLDLPVKEAMKLLTVEGAKQ